MIKLSEGGSELLGGTIELAEAGSELAMIVETLAEGATNPSS